MWSALDSFNPQADRWSDPTDFGNSAERFKSAEDAISCLRSTTDRVDGKIESDIETFRQYFDLLSRGDSYDNRIDQFSTYLRRRGSELSDQCVELGHAKPADTDYPA
jgi:hypothetical protein